ncbi:unnamed protein product [Sphagnum jensenii]|uniref:non-specific serine/threonine protein kinase n=1 Tax=Sphagnum jensenii TaxID=128206 RepID=A0ABP0XFL8_9BRYO
MSRSEPESCQSVLKVESSFAPRQQRPRSLLPDLKESFDSAVLGFWGALKRRASKQPNSCMPLLTRRRVMRRTASWQRLASGRREQSSPSAQPGSSVAGYRRSRSCPTLPSGYVDVTEPRSKYSSDIFKTARPTSLSGDVEEELHYVMSPLYNSSPECCVDDDLSELMEWIDELTGFGKRKQGGSWFDEQDGDGSSTVTTVSETKSAISSALPACEQKDVSVEFVRKAARRHADRALASSARYSKPRIHGQSSSAGSPAGSSTGSSTGSSGIWFRHVKKMKSIVAETFGMPGQYTLAEVLVATHKYAMQIGGSLSGRVYWGKLQTGQEVAVKVWADGSHQAATEFHSFKRVCDHWREHHKYLVQLIGYCDERGEQISIYEYMPGGSLQEHLHEKGMLNLETHALDWGTRLKIALNVAQGLQSMHDGDPSDIYHHTILRYQVFLTEKNWVPKIRLHLGLPTL